MDPEHQGFTEKDAIGILKTLPAGREEEGDSRLESMRKHMERVGLSVEDLDRLNIIHVTGTKGKGSTCAFTEQILRNHGFCTGFFSSPHLVTIRERIRINGKPIGKEIFNKNFLQVYERLDETRDSYEGTMPTFFGLFTLMAIRVFLEEKVDVAVIEVGIGGQNDFTNVVRRPWVCGVSSLGIDHTELLGDTIEKISWHKGGIFKPGVPAFTVKQPDEAMAVLRDRARELNCSLWVCPDLEDYQVDSGPLRLSLPGKHQHSNASLALQLSHAWLNRRFLPDKHVPATSGTNSHILQGAAFKPTPLMVQGLAYTVWPGRAQIIKHGAVTYYLDGAHTVRSMQACVSWFTETSADHERNASRHVTRVLLFSISGERDPAALLKVLAPCGFDLVTFCPYLTDPCLYFSSGVNVSMEDMIMCCSENKRIWKLHTSLGDDSGAHETLRDSVHQVPEEEEEVRVFPSIISALQWIAQGRDPVLADSREMIPLVQTNIKPNGDLVNNTGETHVLITGSLHLVGAALKHLNPAS